MSTVIDCPSCQRKLRVPREFLGKSVRCPTCDATFDAAEPAAASPAAAESAPPAPAPAEPSPILTVPIKLELDDPTPPRAEAPPKEAPPPRRPEPVPKRRDDRDEREVPRRSRRRLRRDFEPCPRCDGDVRRGAVVCPHCGLDLEVQGDGYTRQQPVRRDAEPHRGGMIQVMGILSLISGVVYIFFFIGLPLGIAAWVMGSRDLRKMDQGTMDPNGRKKTRDGRLCGIVGTALNSIFACLALVWFSAVVILATQVAANPPGPPPAAWQGKPPGPGGFNNNPPGWQKGPAQPQGNNFTLSGPLVVTVRRGQTQSVTLTVNRVVGWRGSATVSPSNDENLVGVKVNPDEVKVPAWQNTATFKITADKDADLGEQKVTFSADSDDEDAVSFDVRVNVTAR